MMRTSTTFIAAYVGIGIVLMVVSIASAGKEKRTKGFESFGGGDGIDASLMIFIALLWPLWLISLLGNSSKK